MSRRIDALIALLILAIGIAIGAIYRRAYDRAGGAPDVPAREFGAAVAMACGHGFVNPGYELTRPLAEFLNQQRQDLSCSDLPAVIPPLELNATQRLYRYLMTAAALMWKVTGVSWRRLTPLYAMAYGLTLAAAYGLFRLGIGRVLSVAATAAFAVSAVHLQQLPSLRDYAKAPFILAAMLIMGRLAVGAWATRRALVLAAAFGVVLGIGFGFRNDLLIVVAPWILVVFFATPGALRANLRLKAACVAMSAATFVIAAWPILIGYAAGSNTGHVTMLGLMTPFNAPMGIQTPIYDEGYAYLDAYAVSLVQSFAFRQYGEAVVYMTRPYDHASFVYLSTIARHFPADMVARAYGSMMTVLELPFAVGAHVSSVPFGASGTLVLKFYQEQARVLQLLNGLGGPMTAVALAAIGAKDTRRGLVLLVLLVYFAGYPALQFHVRHFFHLEFIAWWALAFLVEGAVGVLRERKTLSWRALVSQMRPAATFAVITLVVLGGTLAVLRGYQTAHARRLLRDDYLGAERESVTTTVVPAARKGRVLVATTGIWPEHAPEALSRMAYLVAEFSAERCDAEQIPATFRYQARDDSSDFSRDVPVRLMRGAGPTRVLLPVFQIPHWTEFAGIELPAREQACLTGISRIRSNRIPPVLLDLNATPHWEHATLYQTLAPWESSSDGEDALPKVYSHAPEYSLRMNAQPAAFSLAGPHVEYRNAIVQDDTPGQARIAGHPDTAQSLVLVLKDEPLPAGATVVVRGEVRRGGIALAIVRDGRLIDAVEVTARGRFEAAVQVPSSGRYEIQLANRVSGRWLEDRLPSPLVRALGWVPRLWRRNDVTISSFGWLAGAAAASEVSR
jgi:hypothetical protein